jgi:PTS system mannose-specific IIB component
MLDRCLKVNSLNIGGMYFISGKKQILDNICVNNEDIETLKQIYSRRIEIEGRILPDDEKRYYAYTKKRT